MFTIKQGKNENEFLAYDLNNNTIGAGFLNLYEPSDIYEKIRLNIFIDINVDNIKNKSKIKDRIFNKLMKRAYCIKKENANIDVRVYHCCFADDTESVNYYSSKEGFVHDEGMHILRIKLNDKIFDMIDIKNVSFSELELVDQEIIKKLINIHKTVFRPGYTIDDINLLIQKKGWKNITAISDGEIIGNIMLFINKDDKNNQFGWIEDLFVCKGWRKKGIGKNLIVKGLKYFHNVKIDEVRLELWSSNERARSIYQKLGFEFYKETESSIGKFL